MKKADKDNHPIYVKLGSKPISYRIDEEHIEDLKKEREKILEKGIILFDAAQKAKNTFLQIIKERKQDSDKFRNKIKQKQDNGELNQDSLLYQFWDVAQYTIMDFANQKYKAQYDEEFATAITLIAAAVLAQTSQSARKKTVTFGNDTNIENPWQERVEKRRKIDQGSKIDQERE